MQACDICQETVIPDSIYELLDWEAVSDQDKVVCSKCVAGFVRTQDGTLTIKIAKKSASLATITWKKEATEVEDHIETAAQLHNEMRDI